MSPELCPEQWPRSPSNSIITPSTQHGTMLPIGQGGIAKPPAVDADGPRLRHPNVGRTPRHRPPLLSMTPLPLRSKSTMSIQPKPFLTPTTSIKGRFVAGCDNKRYQVIGETMGTSKCRYKNTETQSGQGRYMKRREATETGCQ